jgi:hypothetical protein
MFMMNMQMRAKSTLVRFIFSVKSKRPLQEVGMTWSQTHHCLLEIRKVLLVR